MLFDRRCRLLYWSQSFACSSHKSVISAGLNLFICWRVCGLSVVLDGGHGERVADRVSGTCFGAAVAVFGEVVVALRSVDSSDSPMHVVYTVTALISCLASCERCHSACRMHIQRAEVNHAVSPLPLPSPTTWFRRSLQRES